MSPLPSIRCARKARAKFSLLAVPYRTREDRFPVGLRRSVHRRLARAFTTLGRDREAKAALERSGYPSLDPSLPNFTSDAWVTAKDGFRFRPPRLVEKAPRVYVPQGYDFADIAFVRTDAGVVAIDAGTTPANAKAAVGALRQVSAQPITHVLVTHAHWDHIGGLAALAEPDTKVIAQARFADELQVDLGLLAHPASPALSELRRRPLDGLRARHQQLNPFKFIIYSEWAGADLRPPE